MDLKTVLRAQWDRAAGAAAAAIGLLVLALGWFGASGTAELGKQVPYFISGGLGGMFLLGLGGMLWLSADLRDQWRELRRIRVGLEAAAARAVESLPAPVDVPVTVEVVPVDDERSAVAPIVAKNGSPKRKAPARAAATTNGKARRAPITASRT
ncbi:MAG: hypothetical protein QOJ67_3225 [Acidimicrobiaceae bacterium]|jgi:hypothetical protein